MTKRNKLSLITSFLDERYPNVGCELKYNKDYELVIAVMLSAQTTDIAVNKVTENLFKTYPTLEALANADLSVVEDIIHSIGLYKNKAKHVIAIAKYILDNFREKTYGKEVYSYNAIDNINKVVSSRNNKIKPMYTSKTLNGFNSIFCV